ncbi:MAG: ABC transporter substrate-binding protein, partial [Brevinema sp.]
VLHQLLLRILENEQMSINDIEFISLGVQEALPAMLTGDLDAALLVGPPSVMAEQRGGRILYTGEGLIDGSTVIVSRDDFIQQYPEIIKTFLQSHQESIEFMNTHPEKSMELIMQEVNLPKELILRMLPDYDFSPQITDIDIQNLNTTQDFLFQEGLIPKKIDLSRAIHIIK